jgi:hypothetical protein
MEEKVFTESDKTLLNQWMEQILRHDEPHLVGSSKGSITTVYGCIDIVTRTSILVCIACLMD